MEELKCPVCGDPITTENSAPSAFRTDAEGNAIKDGRSLYAILTAEPVENPGPGEPKFRTKDTGACEKCFNASRETAQG